MTGTSDTPPAGKPPDRRGEDANVRKEERGSVEPPQARTRSLTSQEGSRQTRSTLPEGQEPPLPRVSSRTSSAERILRPSQGGTKPRTRPDDGVRRAANRHVPLGVTRTTRSGQTRPWRHRAARAIRKRTTEIAISVVVTLATTAILAVPGVLRDPPYPTMAGDFNVAVASFRPVGRHLDEYADIATSLRTELAQRLRALHPDLTVEVGYVGRVVPDSELDLAKVAAKMRADVIISGTVRVEGDETEVSPEIFFAPKRLVDALEVTGVQALDDVRVIGDLSNDLMVRPQLRTRLLHSLIPIAELIPGLAYYQSDQFPAAQQVFTRLVRGTDSLGPRVSALAHLMLGNVNIRLHRYEQARTHYELSLNHYPGFIRARLGLAQLAYVRAAGGCKGRAVNSSGLAQSERVYRQILHQSASEPLISVRATYGVGQVLACRSQAQLTDEWSEAREAFSRIARTYERTESLLLRGLASEAYAGMALADSPRQGTTPSVQHLRRAIDEYARAASLSTDPERRALFRRLGAHLERRASSTP